MPRWFNIAGPCRADIHYMLPAVTRLPGVKEVIDQQAYFVLHAPRQTGKTTSMWALAQELTASGQYVSVLLSAEAGSAFNDYPDAAEQAILSVWQTRVTSRLPREFWPPPWPEAPVGGRISAALKAWTQALPRPLVLFVDEIDSLRDATLVLMLRQLRDGYNDRPQAFPWSLALIGLRDVRDYKVASGGGERLHTASPFNIKTDSLTLENFTLQDVAALYQQHTDDTGQVFTPAATALAFELTQGQPWLVNALARQAVEKLAPERTQPITPEIIEQAKEILIERQDTHLDSLAERLREPRVRRIIEPMIAGQTLGDVPQDDRRFLLDLGLVRRDPNGGLAISNPIYREVIPRVLAQGTQDTLPRITPTWLKPDGALDADRLLDAFLAFWREHGQALLKSAPYHEVAPHLVLMAFLHRVVNGGGSLQREYAVGMGRLDILLRFGEARLAMELKTWRDDEPDPLSKGLSQLDAYLAGLGLDTGWLVIFDQRAGQPRIAERTTTTTAVTPAGRSVTVIRA